MTSWIFLAVAFTTILSAVDGAGFSYTPSDVTAMVGETVNFTCGVKVAAGEQDTVRWYRIVHEDNPAGEVIYTYYIDDPINTDKFAADGNAKRNILQVKNLVEEDAGIYVCERLKSAEKVRANLIILDKPVPITPPKTVKTGQKTELQCGATFAAPRESEISPGQKPVMKTYLGDKLLDVTEVVHPGLPGTKWWTMKQTASITASNVDNGKELICSIETGTPYYHLDAQDTFWVQHSVSEISVQSLTETYFVGDTINCTANGNPVPTYEWQPIEVPQMTGSRTFQSPQLEITPNLIGMNTWKCVASNNAGGKVTKDLVVSFEVQANPNEANAGASTGGGTSTVAIALGVVIPIIVIGIVLLVGFIVYRQKSKKENKSGGETPTVPKDLPPNPKPPVDRNMVVLPQVYEPEKNKLVNGKQEDEGPDPESGSALLEEKPKPLPRYQTMPTTRAEDLETNSHTDV